MCIKAKHLNELNEWLCMKGNTWNIKNDWVWKLSLQEFKSIVYEGQHWMN